MLFMLVCTEGKVSEPALINALVSGFGGQAPNSTSMNIEVLPLPLGGNQGHVKLIAAADKAVAKECEEGLAGLAGEDDVIEKWIIVDHDDMESHGIEPTVLRKNAKAAGYTLIINKPNFEFFVLAALSSLKDAKATRKENIIGKINDCIVQINEDDGKNKGFTKDMLMPKYTKKKFVTEKLFGLMLNYHPEITDKMSTLKVEPKADSYTEMPKIVERIKSLYSE